jgi:ferritin
MLSQNIQKLLNDQINKELYSSYLYQGIANYYGERGLHGFKSWFNKQAKEELEHAEKINNYLIDEGAHVVLNAVAYDERNFKDNKEPLDLQLEHEKFVTASINNIYEASIKENDHRTALFLNWFISEQAEEEQQSTELIEKYALLGKTGEGLYLLDKELAKRQ